MDYGKTLKKIRMDKGMTQGEVAEGIISHSFYAKIEKNESSLTVDRFFDILKKFNMNMDEFSYIHDGFKQNIKTDMFTKLQKYYYSENGTENIQKLREQSLKLYENNNDGFYQRFSIIAYCLIQRNLKKDINPVKVEPLKKYLFDIERWYRYDISLFISTMDIFDLETILVLSDKVIKNIGEYKDFSAYENEILLALINLVFVCYSNKKIDEGDFYLILLKKRQKNPKFLYERNVILFLEGISEILHGDIEAGKITSTKAIDIFETLNMVNFSQKYKEYLKEIL